MKYFIIAGDYSGQIKGIELMNAISIEDKNAQFYIYGSSNMTLKNSELLYDFENLKIMGFIDVIKNILKFKNILKSCKNSILKINPDIVILIDFAGFNLRIAEFNYKNRIKTVYFIPPKVWAWNERRIKNLKKYVNNIIVIFKFEFEYFNAKTVKTHYFGNPDSEFLIKNFNKINRIKNQILLMPGSRQHEVDYALPIFEKLIKSKKTLQFKIAGIDNLKYKLLEKHNNLSINYNETHQLMAESEFGLIFSGTANFEASNLELPHVVCFKTNFINYLLAKFLIKVEFIALSNLILNKKLVPELIQNEFNFKNCISVLEDFHAHIKIKNDQIFGFKAIKNLEFQEEIYKKIAQIVVLEGKIA